MKKKKILIIGLGKIGFYHLKALEKFHRKLDIYIYDKKKINLEDLTLNKIVILNNLKKNINFDLVIISTSSKERFKIFQQLVNNNKVKKIIFEKFVFSKKIEFLKTSKIIKNKKIKAWVNCLRREIQIFKTLKQRRFNQFKIIYQGSDWGMACNSIHFLDLFAYLHNKKKVNPIEINLERKIYKSKRKGYMEFKGDLKFSSGNFFLFLSDKFLMKKKFLIVTKNKIFSFNKKENICTEKNINNKVIKKHKCEGPEVSAITYKIIKKIINNKNINLSTFEQSLYYHNILIEIFNKHLMENKFKNKLNIT